MNAQTKDRDRQTRQVIRDAIARSVDEDRIVEVELPGSDEAEVYTDIDCESSDADYACIGQQMLDVWGTTLDDEAPYRLQVIWQPDTWRVYEAPEGEGLSYCGEYESKEEAQAVAEQEPAGLPKSLWDTAAAAGHVHGMSAPPTDGEEDEEPVSWHGAAGNHCVVRVYHPARISEQDVRGRLTVTLP